MSESVLILDRTSPLRPVAYRECSAARAPVRALAEYLRTLRFPSTGGQHTEFVVVRDLQAEPEDYAGYPGACVFPEGSVQYGTEDGGLQPIYDESGDLEDGSVMMMMGEIKVELQIHIWTNEVEDRESAITAVEDALAPVEWMSGFFLEMPHYHNLRASYQIMAMTYEDPDTDVQRRYRKCNFRVQATCPYVRVFRLPRLDPRAAVEVS